MSWAAKQAGTEYEPPSYTVAQFKERWARIKEASAANDGPSLADRLALCEAQEPGSCAEVLDELSRELGHESVLSLAYDPEFWLRPKQLVPFRTAGTWRVLFFVAGRGSGKTRMAAEWVVWRLLNGARIVVLIGPTDDDIRKFMLGGVKGRLDTGTGQGLFDVIPPWLPYVFKDDANIIEFPTLGAVIHLHSAMNPEMRGLEPDTVWGDELLKWRYPDELISNLRLATRAIGAIKTAILFTTSPRKVRFLRDIAMDPDTLTVWGNTDENQGNVEEAWLAAEHRRLDGTKRGLEELGGELGYEEDGDTFKATVIDELRRAGTPPLDRIVVSVDPTVSTHRTSDEVGIVLGGLEGSAQDGKGYLLEDLSGRHEWTEWGRMSVKLAIDRGASVIVIERDKVGDSGIANLRTSAIALGWVVQPRPGFKHLQDIVGPNGRRIQLHEVSSRQIGDKQSRASMVASLYELKRVHHVGHFPELELEQTSFNPTPLPGDRSPNRLDAWGHAVIFLFELDRPPEHDGRDAMRGMTEANARLAASAPSHGSQWVAVGGNGRRDLW